jgi:hypothetical protein
MNRFSKLLLAAILAAWGAPALADTQLSVSEARGKAAYFGETGSGLDGSVARIQGTGFDLPASSFPCASCHGARGQGRSERGVQPTNLKQSSLTKPYNVQMQAGRVRPAYNQKLFARAVREGVDSGGSSLNHAMPRFDVTDRALADIWAFLAKIDTAGDPGISDTELHVGVYLGHDAQSAQARDVRNLLLSFAEDINGLGGVHGRQLRWVWLQTGDTSHSVFAILLAPSRHAVVTGNDVPILGWWGEGSPDRAGFRLVAGPEEQLAALRMFSVQELGVTNPADACSGAPGRSVLVADTDCIDQAAGAELVLMPHEVFAGASQAQRLAIAGELYVALPVDFNAVPRQSRANFLRIRAMSGSGGQHILQEARAYTGAALLTEALTRAGRQLDRLELIETIEDISGFRGGIAHQMSFSANDHTGANGAFIVRYDKETLSLQAEGVWIDPTGRR